MAIKRSFILSSGIGVSADNLFVVNNTNSVSSTTGSIVLSGGIGIGQSASISGRLQMFNGANYTSFVSSASGNTVYTLPATSPATGSSVLQSTSAGVLSWVPMTATGGGGAGTVYDGSLNSIPYYPTAGTAITGSSSFTNTGTSINIGYTTAATNSSSGALTIVGGVGIGGSLYVAGDLTINGTTTTINSVTLTVDDKNIELGSVVTPSDVTAEGGGITLRGATDKSINWYTGTGWSSSESWNLASGNTYKINNTTVLSNSSLGTGITNSSLTALGTITTGVWSGTSITAYYGGTGLQTTFTVGDLLYANTSFTWGRLTANSNSGYVLTSAGSGATPTYVAQSTLSVGNATTSGTATTAQNINVVLASTNTSHPLLFTPTSGSASGLAVSSNTTLVYNPSTDILSVSGAAVTAATGSSNTTTGAFVVTGGVGIGGSLNVNNKTRFNDEVYINSISNNALYITGSGSVAYTWSVGTTLSSSRFNLGNDLCLVPVGGNQSVLQSFWGLQLAGNTQLNATSYTASAVGANSAFGVLIPNQQAASVGLAVIAHASQTGDLQIWTTPSGLATTTYLAVKSNGQLYSYASIASTNTTSGALIVTGGVGIGQSVSVGGRLQMFNGANFTAFVSSASGNTVYTLPATTPGTGSSVLQSTSAGVLSWVPMTAGSSSGNTAQNIVVNTAGNANVFHPILFTPSSLSAGSAVSSDSTISFNPSTEILNVSGLAITSGTASTNTTTGALVVRGGLGVTGQLSFATASFGFTGITTNPTMSFIGATSSSPITLTVLTDNSLNWEGSQGSVFSIDSNLSTGEIFSVSDISGLPIISASAGQTVTFNEFGGYTQFGNGTLNSSSTTTGALVVSGGVGITGNANIGGTVRLTNTTASTSSTTGAMTVSGGVGIGGSVSIAGRLQLFNSSNFTAFVSSATGNTVYTLPATSPATGSSVLQSTASGLMSWVPMTSGSSSGTVNSGTANFAAYYASTSTAVSENANLQFTGTGLSVGGNINSTSTKSGALYVNGGLGVTGNAFIGGTVNITNTTNATSVSSGALVVSGGLGVDGDVYINNRANSRLNIMHSAGDEGGEIFLNKSVTNTTLNTGLIIDIFQNTLRFFEAGGSNRGFYLDISSGGNSVGTNIMGGASSGTVNSGTATFAAFYGGTSNAVSENANLQFTGTGLSVGGNINSTSTKSGALYVNGGLGVTGNAFIGGTTTIQSSVASISSSTGALVVSGGAGIAQSISVGGRLQLFNSSNYTAFVSSATGNTVYTLPATSPAVGTSYLTSNSSGVMSWTAPNKANYVLSFGAGFTPTADSADSVSLNVPYLPDGTLKYYYIKRIEYRNETLSGGTGLSFYLQRHTTGNASWNTTNTITAGSGASFYIGPSVYASSFTTIASSAGVAGSVISGDYLRLFFTGVGSAANLSIAMTIEEQ